jgi:hypothetical protein
MNFIEASITGLGNVAYLSLPFTLLRVLIHRHVTRRHPLLAIYFPICYHASDMTAYTIPHAPTLSPDLAARKAARRKIIEKARQLERESYKAMMQRRRQLQASNRLDRMV